MFSTEKSLLAGVTGVKVSERDACHNHCGITDASNGRLLMLKPLSRNCWWLRAGLCPPSAYVEALVPRPSEWSCVRR
jgi:hypothetical protein